MKEAMLFYTLPNGAVKCELCNRYCIIQIGQRGFCGVRENRGGVLQSLVYGKAVVYGVDPIEKKPFYHFMPGTQTFSFSTVGCNFACENCQNWEISQIRGTKNISGEDLPPQEIVKMAKENETQGIAYTYTEPTIFFEYAYDTAEIAKKEGLYNVFVTNGYMTEKCIEKMQNIDASRIDLKSFNDKHYMWWCASRTGPEFNQTLACAAAHRNYYTLNSNIE
jgi:pyruvate formate lyase activating enzyme